jgi:hypothetical protein
VMAQTSRSYPAKVSHPTRSGPQLECSLYPRSLARVTNHATIIASVIGRVMQSACERCGWLEYPDRLHTDLAPQHFGEF